MPDHISRAFDQDLANLKSRISELGGLAEKLVADSISALAGRDPQLAQSVITADARLDTLQRDIEDQAIATLLRRQPMAIDLREVISANRMASDLERIGDLAKNIAKRVVAISGQFQPPQAVAGVEHMSDLVLSQLKDVLDAYSAHDVEKALDVWKRDGGVDKLYTSMFRELLTYMMEDPRNITFCTHLLFCAKNIERIGDHTTNIAETVHYLVRGQNPLGERPKDDRSNYEQAEASAL